MGQMRDIEKHKREGNSGIFFVREKSSSKQSKIFKKKNK